MSFAVTWTRWNFRRAAAKKPQLRRARSWGRIHRRNKVSNIALCYYFFLGFELERREKKKLFRSLFHVIFISIKACDKDKLWLQKKIMEMYFLLDMQIFFVLKNVL